MACWISPFDGRFIDSTLIQVIGRVRKNLMEEWTLTQVATPAGSRKQLRDAVNDESQTATDFLWLLRKRIGIEYVDFYIDSLIGVIDTVAGWRPYSSYDYPTWAVPPECHFCFKTENSAELIHEIVPRFFP